MYSDEKDYTKFKKVDASSWATLRDNVYIRLVNKKCIPRYNEDIAFFNWIDLAATFSVQEVIRQKEGKVTLSHMLTKQELEGLDITIEDARVDVMNIMGNSRKRRVLTFRDFSMQDAMFYPVMNMPPHMMMQIGGKGEPQGFMQDVEYDFESNKKTENVLIVTNQNNCLGSGYICIPSMMMDVYDRFQENYYIVPMSVHQCMCIRQSYASKKGKKPTYETEDDLLQMVEDFNDRENSSWKDILTYKLYYYIGDDGHVIVPINP